MGPSFYQLKAHFPIFLLNFPVQTHVTYSAIACHVVIHFTVGIWNWYGVYFKIRDLFFIKRVREVGQQCIRRTN